MNHLHKIAKFQFSPSREGGLELAAQAKHAPDYFNSRPRVRAVFLRQKHLSHQRQFQFSPSREGGREVCATRKKSFLFQFSPSREGGRVIFLHRPENAQISILALA